MRKLLALRTVLVTGKGGVGKTTVAASLSRYLAAQGRRVLATELAADGTANSALADAFGIDGISEEPKQVAPNLRLAMLAPSSGHQRFLRDVLPMKILADAAMRSASIRRFLAAAPTFPEMGVLYRLLDLVRQKRRDGTFEHETIVVDLPATGHALALAQIPASILKVITNGPIASAVREGLSLMTDANTTGTVIVTLPETLPVSEALELARGIAVHDVPLAQIFVNRVPFDPFTEEERASVKRMLGAHPPMLGERSLERIDRARVAIARLAAEVDVPIATLQDVWLEGPRLAEEMASLMSVEGAG